MPCQRDCDTFYGDRRAVGGAVVSRKWYAENITTIAPPFRMAMGSIKITRIPVHKKCAAAPAGCLTRSGRQPAGTRR